MHKLLYILCCSVLALVPIHTAAQCCAAGNPDNGQLNGDSAKNRLTLGLAYQYSYSDTYFEGDQRSDFRYMQNSAFSFTSFNAIYGISNRFKIGMDMGYFISKSQTFESGYYREAVGLGDAGITAMYLLNPKSKIKLSPMLRVNLPIGEFDQKYGPVILPIDLQPSAGSFKFQGGLMAVYKWNKHINFFSVANYEYSEKITSLYTTYKYGGLTNIRHYTNINLKKGFQPGVQVWYQYREHAKDQNNNIINATGGQLVVISPYLNYRYNDWKLTLDCDLPIYKNVNGQQLTNKYRTSIRLTKNINLAKKPTGPQDITIIDSLVLQVNGICSMCQNRIQKTALATPGVGYANWDIDTKMLNIKVGEGFNRELLIENLLKAGHDTEGRLASDKAYNALHACCKYR